MSYMLGYGTQSMQVLCIHVHSAYMTLWMDTYVNKAIVINIGVQTCFERTTWLLTPNNHHSWQTQ